jgi:multicomponent Na+:H+ antiporter subunit G
MHALLEILSWGMLVAGGLCGIVGGIGLHRFPDFYSRTHAGGVVDTLSAPLILLGLLLQTDQGLVAIKLILILVFLFFTSPTSGHALVRAAFHHGLKPTLKDQAFDDALITGDLSHEPFQGKDGAPSD